MLCKGCGMNRARISSQFCSQVCEERWNEGKVIRECKKCGRAGKTPPKDEIGEIIHQQQKLQTETGRRLSYGEIVAKMDDEV